MRSQPQLEGAVAGAGSRQDFRQLLAVDVHPLGDGLVIGLHVGIGNFDGKALGFGDLQDFVDDAVERFLTGRLLFRTELNELAPMLDVERRDPVAR